MTFPVDPLEDVPTHLHDLMPPYLNVGTRLGRMIAEQMVAMQPLPWDASFAVYVVDQSLRSLDEEVRKEMPNLPEFVITAMHRQLVRSMSDRLDELHEAAGSHPQGGIA